MDCEDMPPGEPKKTRTVVFFVFGEERVHKFDADASDDKIEESFQHWLQHNTGAGWRDKE